jgi:hypothetical protein
VGLTVSFNADNAKISWRITLRINGLLTVCPFYIFYYSQFTTKWYLTVPIKKKNLEVRPTAVNEVRFEEFNKNLFSFLYYRVRLLSRCESSTKTRIRNLYFVLETTKCVFLFSFFLSVTFFLFINKTLPLFPTRRLTKICSEHSSSHLVKKSSCKHR